MDRLAVFSDIASVFPEPMLLVASGGVVRACNGAARALFGDRAVVERPLTELVASVPADVGAYLSLCARSRQFVVGSLQLRSADGAPRPFRCDGAIFDGLHQDGERLVLLRLRPRSTTTGRYIELTQRIEQLQAEVLRRKAAEQALAETTRLKDQFLATVSHELRTPLNAVLGWTRMVRSGHLDPSGALRALETIERNAQIQAVLIEDLLDISRIAAGNLRLHRQDVALHDVIEKAVDAVRPAADNKQLTLAVEVDRSTPLRVFGDAARLQQVVWNLLTNAVKFTPPGGFISVRLFEAHSHGCVVVADNGSGFAPSLRSELFQPFRQGDSSTTRAHGGLGLGLAITRQLVEAHGGVIEADSPGIGQGATFTVRLPLRSVDAASSATEAARPGVVVPGDLAGTLALVVDDERDARDLLVAVLQQCGARTLEASSAAEALELLERERPDVLLADIAMPRHDGYHLVRTLRQTEAATGRRLPAIAVTAYASLRDREDAIGAGFDTHVAKPVDPASIVAAIAALRPSAPQV